MISILFYSFKVWFTFKHFNWVAEKKAKKEERREKNRETDFLFPGSLPNATSRSEPRKSQVPEIPSPSICLVCGRYSGACNSISGLLLCAKKKKKRKLQSGIEVGIEHRHILEWGCLKQALSPWVTMTFFLSILNNSSILIYWHVLNWIRLDKQWPSCNPWFFIFIKYRIKHLQITNNFSVSTGRKGLILLFSLLCTYYGNSKA